MLSILVTIRDALIAAALAWVGVTFDAARSQAEPGCREQACQTQSTR